MALREGEWRGHRQWICDEHGFDTLKESTALTHLAEVHADDDQVAAPEAGTTKPAAPVAPAKPPKE